MHRKVTVVLADPPNPRGNPYMLEYPNLGLLYLASSLRSHRSDCKIVYVEARNSVEQHLAIVQRLSPDIYGLSFTSAFANRALKLVDQVKALCPDTLIVCGGPHPTADATGVLNKSRADICCIGEGDRTIVEIVDTFSRGADWSTVSGIAFKTLKGNLSFTCPRPLIPDLDSIPFPAWDLIDFGNYSGSRKRRSSVSTAIVASRGCQFDCTFCSSPVWKMQQPWVRKRSPSNLAEEVECLYKLGVREIYIRSDTMNTDLGWAIAVFNDLATRLSRDTMKLNDNELLGAYFSRIGRRGGKKAAARMSANARRERARAAGRASGKARRRKGGKS